MTISPVLLNILSAILFIGGPVLPLLLLATEIDRWHKAHGDPPADQFTSDQVE